MVRKYKTKDRAVRYVPKYQPDDMEKALKDVCENKNKCIHSNKNI